MAKAKTRKRGAVRGGTARRAYTEQQAAIHTLEEKRESAATGSALARTSRRSRPVGQASFSSGVVSTAMVALGCWGMSIFFLFLYTTDPNHLLFGVMAVLMALMWSYAFIRRMRKPREQK